MKQKKNGVGDLTEAQIKVALVEELKSDAPRIDAISRLVGRLNRIRGRRLHHGLLQLIGKPEAAKKADALLGDNR